MATTPRSGTPTPPSSTADATLIVSLDTLQYADGSATRGIDFADGADVVSFFESLTGQTPEVEEVKEPYGDAVWYRLSHFDGVSVGVYETGHSFLTIDSASVAGVPLRTQSGLTVGASRQDVLAAGGWDEWDQDGDGVADYLGAEPRNVEGTQSLTRPGEGGREYFLFVLDGDVVTQIQWGNDFSDV
ncbi:hypothetical protein [Microbacterium album]|uniref:Uncharacterized protein n=1 Tax=Microbacterium album TaxID=2053191 RepID=A0A917IDW6_9MICO|nr:hypothetical protein [Microbacterium album]GGH38632.1 hypothetical protein GCM10010921_09330 [Microbacterium album]